MRTAFAASLLIVAVVAQQSVSSGPEHVGDRTFVEMIPMRDGTLLHTRFLVPRGVDLETATNLTVVLDRSPYGQAGIELLADLYTPYGFVACGQDMRGTQLSEGNFTVWHTDADDAYDTMQWITDQSWSSGLVNTIGGSADGICSFVELMEPSPALNAQFIIWSTPIGYEIIFPGGTYRESLAAIWIGSTVPDQKDQVLAEVMANEYPNPWWDAINGTGHYDQVTWPSVMWAGWYDIFLAGTLSGFEGYQKQSTGVQGASKLFVDPLGHCQSGASYFKPDLIAGRTAAALLQSYELYGVRDMQRDFEAVTFYVMGPDDGSSVGGFWSSQPDWPVAISTDLYLHADGTASYTPPTDGEGESSTSFTYDPADPVPSLGGNNLEIACGPLDQSPLENRADVLVFTSHELEDPVSITGALTATIYVSSDAIDTDFMVKVTDVYPDGQSRLIQDGAVRMRWRENAYTEEAEPVYMEQGEVYKMEVSLWNSSYIFATGHAIRVAVTSSNAPRFSINPNNGRLLDDPELYTSNVTATNTLHHSAKYPSKLSIPVVTMDQLPEFDVIKEATELLGMSVDELGNSAMAKFVENHFSEL